MGKRNNKGGGGNSHDRAIAGSSVRPPHNKPPQPPAHSLPPDPTLLERVFLFLENGTVLTVMGIAGGLAGFFIDGKWFLVLIAWVLLGLHRSPALKGYGKTTARCAYIGVALVSGIILWFLGVGVNRSREHIPTITEIVSAFKGAGAGTIQQTTNIYPTKEIIRERVPPEISIGAPYFLDVENGKRVYNAHIINVGGSTARHAVDAAKAIIAEKSNDSEDALFKSISLLAKTGNLRQKDVAPGDQYGSIKAIPLEANEDELKTVNRGDKVIYIGLLSTYSDDTGHMYHTPRCVIYTNEQNRLPGLCQNHNVRY
jgi:hypothetical protein